ncbi:MAG: SiaB family protein kinase [Crocinitomicaceae bacterium]|nr:SiaB family protein kinase [Crocinitomicaceae bacterium]
MNHSEELLTVTESAAVFKKILEKVKKEQGVAVIMRHCGIFSEDLIISLAESSEELLISYNEKKDLIRRMFSILLEGLGNIRKHGESNSEGIQNGIFIFAKDPNGYKILLGNLIQNSLINQMVHLLDHLNSLSENEIKERFTDVLSKSILANKGGSGLGFINIKMKSKSKLNYEFYPINKDYSLFSIDFFVMSSNGGSGN